VIVAHSLGSIIAYNILSAQSRRLNVPLFLTVGCPLGIRAVRIHLSPISFPNNVTSWFNGFDPRDVVALYPLDRENFNVSPAIENYGRVNNVTDDRHGIVGYLNDREIAGRIITAVAG
jgi:hypothetical protein